MAETTLADAIVPEIFTEYVLVRTELKSAFRQSGVVVDNPLIDRLMAGGGQTFNVPFWNDLVRDEPNVSTDDPAQTSVPKKITSGKEKAIRHNINQSWSAMDLVSALAGSDPMTAIANLVGDYWVDVEQAMIIRSLQGIVADNIANDSNDFVHDIGLNAVGTPGAANFLSGAAFNAALQTLGDSQRDTGVAAMHSVVYTRAKDNNLIEFIPESINEAATEVPTFLGHRVVLDDGLPMFDDGNGNDTYDTYIFAPGFIQRGTSAPRVPTEVDREPAAGRGGGQEILYSRQEWALHPRGFEFIEGGITDESPTYAELSAAAQWNRVFPERKQVKFAVLRTNG